MNIISIVTIISVHYCFFSHFFLAFLLTLPTKRMTVFAAQSCAVDETNTIAHYDCKSLSKIAFNKGMPGLGVFLVHFGSFVIF